MAADDVPRFGDLVRRHRVGAALSQEELAHRAGLSVRGLSDLERGMRQAPRLDTVRLLVDALELAGSERAAFVAAARPATAAADAIAGDRGPIGASIPVPATRLIGREEELQAILDLLARDEIRLVTLTGAGGTGKTHLALVAAAEAARRYPDGAVFVDLAPLSDFALVVPTVAAALGVRESAGASPLEAIKDFLSERRLLLLLDNYEHVLPAASDLAVLLATSPGLAVLATSREPLRIRAEHDVAIAPLLLPDSDRLPSLPDLARVPSVALFLERARAASADFALTTANADAVAAVCRRLDGLPLALELAAARVRVLPVAALLARLEPRLPLLTGGGRDLPARQRTMRAAIAWSYDLLAPEVQALFRRLSVFTGGFTLAAAEAVTPPPDDSTVLDGIGSLVQQSVLRQAPGHAGEPRYAMLETVREFGLENLAMAGELTAAREAHANYFLRQAAEFRHGALSGLSEDGLLRLMPERDNVRLALGWFHERGETQALLELCSPAIGLWFAPGLYQDGLHWIGLALDRANPGTPEARAVVLNGAAALAVFQGDVDGADGFAAAALDLARELEDPLHLGRALNTAGLIAYRRGEFGRSQDLHEEACRHLRSLAVAVPEPILRLGIALLDMGDLALAQEQFDRAAARYEEALMRFGPGPEFWGPIDAQAGLAGVHYCSGDLWRAAVLYTESLNRAHALGATLLIASAMVGLAGVAAESGRPEAGARLLGASEATAASFASPFFPRDRPIRNRCLAALAAAIGEDRVAAARGEGLRLGLAVAIEEALAVGEAVSRS